MNMLGNVLLPIGLALLLSTFIAGYALGRAEARQVLEAHERLGEVLTKQLDRFRELQDISSAELATWVAQNQRLNDYTLEISTMLADQVRGEAWAGVWVMLLVVAGMLVVIAIWVVWELRVSRKAETTLENFQRAVAALMKNMDPHALEEKGSTTAIGQKPEAI